MSFRLGVALGCSGFQLPFLWRGRYLYFLQRLLLGACRNCFLPLNPGVLHLARCIWVLFEAFCAFFTAGCETPKWIAVANSPFYLEFLSIRRLFPGVRVRLDGLFRGRV